MKKSQWKLGILCSLMYALIACASHNSGHAYIHAPPDYLATKLQYLAPNAKKVAMVADIHPPEISAFDIGMEVRDGALRGAGKGAIFGLGLTAECTTADISGSVLCIFLAPVFVVGGTVTGAVYGSVSGYSEDTIAQAEAKARKVLTSGYLQEQILGYMQQYGQTILDYEFIQVDVAGQTTFSDNPDYQSLSDDSIDIVLELKLIRLALENDLEIKARARLISVQTGKVLSDSNYWFHSAYNDPEELADNGYARLQEAIRQGLQRIAEDVVDENFLLFYPNHPQEIAKYLTSSTIKQQKQLFHKSVPHYVLSPVYPELDACVLCDANPLARTPHKAPGNLEFEKIDTVQPKLQWEKFPRQHDQVDDKGHHHQITDVTYDVRVFDAGLPEPASNSTYLIPDMLVYSANAIHDQYHIVKTALEPCTNYFWTVRARFNLDGRARVTEWSGIYDSIAVFYRRGTPWANRNSGWYYYPFRTPCSSKITLN